MRRAFVALVVVLFAPGCGGKNDKPAVPATSTGAAFSPAPEGLSGVLEIPVDGDAHVKGKVSYPTAPPAGGDHQAAWQNCGFYSVVVTDEAAVHSLEHGAVWITYKADLDAATKAKLSALAQGDTHVLVSPYPANPTTLVVTAWARQLRLDRYDEAQIAKFISTYGKKGPTVPEPGAVCKGGVGQPPDRPNAQS